MQSLGDIFIPSCCKATRKRGLFSFVEEQLEKIKEETSSSRIPDVSMPMAKNIE